MHKNICYIWMWSSPWKNKIFQKHLANFHEDNYNLNNISEVLASNQIHAGSLDGTSRRPIYAQIGYGYQPVTYYVTKNVNPLSLHSWHTLKASDISIGVPDYLLGSIEFWANSMKDAVCHSLPLFSLSLFHGLEIWRSEWQYLMASITSGSPKRQDFFQA